MLQKREISNEILIRNQSFSIYLALSSFNLGYLLSNLNVLNDRLRYFYNQHTDDPDSMDAIISTIFFIGALFGTALSGFINFTPIKSIMMGNYIQIVGILCSFYVNEQREQVIIFARFILGIGAGFSISMVSIVICNLCHHKIRGSLAPLHQIMIAMGICTSQSISQQYCLPENSNQRSIEEFGQQWIIIQGFPLLPISIQIVMNLTQFRKIDILPSRSQRNLQANPTLDVNTNYLVNYFYDEHDVNEVLEQKELNKNSEHAKSNGEDLLSLFEPRYRHRFLFCMQMAVAHQMSGMQVLVLYSSSIQRRLGDGMFVYKMNFGLGFIGIIGSILASLMLDWFGRRNLLLTTFTLQTLVQLTFCLVNLYQEEQQQLLGILTIVQRFMFEVGYGPIFVVQMGETLPVLANNQVWVVKWMMIIIISLMSKQMLVNQGLSITYSIFICFNVLTLILVQFFMIETKGFSRYNISMLFLGNGKKPERETIQQSDSELESY